MRLPPFLQTALLIATYIGGIAAVGIALRLILNGIGPHPTAAQTVYWIIVPAGGLGGLIAFWFLASRVEFLYRGYRIAAHHGRPYYEERDASGGRREFSFEWFPLTEGYRPRCLVRLPPRNHWDLEAPPWARGRREEIADRITNALRSHEGWPALLMPDAPATAPTREREVVVSALIEALLEDCPEWARHVRDDSGHLTRVLLSVPSPQHPTHRLEVACRPEAFEVAYECGKPGLRATRQFSLTHHAAAIFCVREFLREMRDGEMVVLVRRLDLVARWRRRARYGAEFCSVSRSGQYSRSSLYGFEVLRFDRRPSG